MNKPVNVGIPYSNEQEREWAIAQAERYGYKRWIKDDKYRNHYSQYDCVWLHRDGTWLDLVLRSHNKTIHLERPDGKKEPFSSWYSEEKLGFSYDMDKLKPEYKADGTIILKPKKKVKVWLVAIKDFLGDKIVFEVYYNHNQAYKNFMETVGALEVIEREYEI